MDGNASLDQLSDVGSPDIVESFYCLPMSKTDLCLLPTSTASIPGGSYTSSPNNGSKFLHKASARLKIGLSLP